MLANELEAWRSLGEATAIDDASAGPLERMAGATHTSCLLSRERPISTIFPSSPLY
jgi:hypothetical protein